MEFDLLAALARQPGKLLSRAQLVERLRDRRFDDSDRSIDVHITALRKKLGDDTARASLYPHRARRRLSVAAAGTGMKLRPPLYGRALILLALNLLLIALLLIGSGGGGQASARQSGIEAGADHHLVKPVNVDELKRYLG